MGLREKVALLILVEFFVQVTQGQYVQHTNKRFPSLQIPYKKYKIRKHAKTIQSPITREGCVARIFNFPEVEYSLPPTPISPLHFNQKFDLHSQHVPKLNSSPSKYSGPSTNEPESRENKNNHKNSAIGGTKVKKFTALPETASVPNTCLNELFFPSVDYPLDITDLWTPHYWNRFPQFQPETKSDTVDFSINTKPKKEKAKIAKGSRKDATVHKILNSTRIETKTLSKTEVLPIKYPKDAAELNIKEMTAESKQNASNCENYSINSSVHVEILPNKEVFTPTSMINESKQCITNSFTIKNNSVISQEIMNTQSDNEITPTKTPMSQTSSCTSSRQENKDINTRPVTLAQNSEKSPYFTQSNTSTISNIVTFLKTVAPILNDSNEDIFENSVLLNSQTAHSLETNLCDGTEVENEYEDPQLPDDMGYTIMYPELFSSISTSTMSPLDENKIDSAWMYPEFDNHTFNTYSDEVEQCYILVP